MSKRSDPAAAAYRRTVAALTGRLGPSSGSGRVRRFTIGLAVSDELIRQEPVKARALAHDMIQRQSTEPFRGPRGGTYRAIGDPFDFRESNDGDSWMFGRWSFAASVNARYVRPPRTSAPKGK